MQPPRSSPLSPTERGDVMLNQNVVREATRLTRAGRLVEATALLQRMLRGESTSEPSGRTTTVAPARLEPPTIDLEPNVVEGKDSRKRGARFCTATRTSGPDQGSANALRIRPTRFDDAHSALPDRDFARGSAVHNWYFSKRRWKSSLQVICPERIT